jgi:hypothetical protein
VSGGGVYDNSGLKTLHVTNLEMATCKAIVQEGARKGSGCKFPPSEHGYCGRHERNREYDEGIAAGNKWCRFFFRGCNSLVTDTVSCDTCRQRLTKKQHPCQHEGCTFKVNEPGFCKKHIRDKYRQDGVNYCDIARGCFNVCIEGYASCQECREKNRIVDTARYQKRKEIIRAIQITKPNSLCAYCGKDFEPFKTRYKKDSMSCKDCNEYQAQQDEKRKDRVRNYKNEHSKNLPRYYREYIKSAAKRGFEITIDFDIFSNLVQAPCHYCGNATQGETNGIDRVDNSLGYTKENCVSCCWTCNRMKRVYHKSFFLQKCHVIKSKTKASAEFFIKWQMYYYRSCYKHFGTYKKEAEARGLIFNITENEWTKITRSKCYLCGYQSPKGIGIDRLDNNDRTYTKKNCMPCCGSCNDMKGENTIDELIEQCNRICTLWPHPPEEVPENPLKEFVENGGLNRNEDRTHWKGNGLYYAVLTDCADLFYEKNSDVISAEEFDTLCREIKETEKTLAIQRLQKLIRALKQRRLRAIKPAT